MQNEGYKSPSQCCTYCSMTSKVTRQVVSMENSCLGHADNELQGEVCLFFQEQTDLIMGFTTLICC